MKITTQDASQLSGAGAAGQPEIHKTGSGNAGCASSGGSDHVSFSSALGSLSRAMQSDVSSREAKVQALAAQYQSGSYAVDSTKVSQALVSEALGG
jgi:anti-sigma28 factor (negative regulator of flagellin synthesis)